MRPSPFPTLACLDLLRRGLPATANGNLDHGSVGLDGSRLGFGQVLLGLQPTIEANVSVITWKRK